MDKELKFKCLEFANKICGEKEEEKILNCATNLYNFITTEDIDLLGNMDYFSDNLALHCEYLFDIFKDDVNLEHIYELLKIFYKYSRNDRLEYFIKLYEKLKK